jgi:murein hydrolase activator
MPTRLQRAAPTLTAIILLVVCASARQDDRPAPQADRARTEALARRAGERLQALRAEADRLAAEERTLLTELRQFDVDRRIKAEELAAIERDAASVSAEMSDADARIARLEAADLAARPALRARIAEMYKLGQGRYLRLLLSATDVRQAGRASRMVAALAKIDADRVAGYRRTLDELSAAREGLEERRQSLERLEGDTRAAQAALARSAEARAALVARIDRERDLNAQFAAELRGAQDRLRQTLAGLAEGEPAAASALPLGPFRGDLPWPADGTLGRRADRATARGGAVAAGIEILAPDGAPVRAVHDGRVAFAGSFSGFGNLVILDHGARSFSLYGDLQSVAVQVGGTVDRGDIVGEVGSLPAGPAGLYFELRVDGAPVDPLQWLTAR